MLFRSKPGYHRGVDLKGAMGDPIFAVSNGRILLAGPFIEEGNMVVIDHGQGLISASMHMSKILVHEGEMVKAGQTIGTLSRGMRQRLAIARTLLHDPPVLLLDEPAAGLDPQARHDLQELFKRLAREGKTLVVSSHILTELEDYCSHIAILDRGMLVASGPAERVRQSFTTDRRVRIRCAGDTSKVEALLCACESVKRFSPEEGGWAVSFAGSEEELAAFLKCLVEAGVQVTFFGEEKGSLQDTYLALLRGGRP